MRKKRISVIALMKILGLIMLTLVHIYSMFFYIYRPRRHTSFMDFPNSVWECEYNGAKITLFVRGGADVRGYIDKNEDRTYISVTYDSRLQVVEFIETTKEEFYEGTHELAHKNLIFGGDFRCTDTSFTAKSKVQEVRELDFWQTEEPITLVFYRVSG